MGSLIFLLLLIAVIVGWWKIFEKAGEPGWACLIPLYNVWVFVRIAGRQWYWFIALFIPIISLIAAIILSLDMCKRFGKPLIFAAGLLLLPWIFYPILGFSQARYHPASSVAS